MIWSISAASLLKSALDRKGAVRTGEAVIRTGENF